MRQPDVPAMEEIRAVLQDISEMEEAIETLKKRLRELPSEMAEQLNSRTDKVEAARFLYWMEQDIPSKAIAEGLLDVSTYHLREEVGEVKGIIECERCQENISFRSRTHLKKVLRDLERDRPRYAEGYTVICEPCWEEVQEERKEKRRQRDERQKARIRELRSMIYQEYLQTPEWQERRKRHLKSAGYKCQVCNASDTVLDVHHRTYERRGQENYKDLIVLCRKCHDIFHQEGRLAD